ncbi:hypothetical protein C7W93_06180 [Glaciimonas sp. PCH181]|nr:hypothetical protein C7W93_06180 [Glaciimonas sp. PCH181]
MAQVRCICLMTFIVYARGLGAILIGEKLNRIGMANESDSQFFGVGCSRMLRNIERENSPKPKI